MIFFLIALFLIALKKQKRRTNDGVNGKPARQTCYANVNIQAFAWKQNQQATKSRLSGEIIRQRDVALRFANNGSQSKFTLEKPESGRRQKKPIHSLHPQKL